MSDQQYAPPPVGAYREGNGLAVASMVLGILGILCLGPLAAVPAIICGHLASGKVRRGEMVPDAKGYATAGLVTGYVGLAIWLLIMLAYGAIIAFAIVGSQIH